jgi:hypothetical protein
MKLCVRYQRVAALIEHLSSDDPRFLKLGERIVVTGIGAAAWTTSGTELITGHPFCGRPETII